ncbi:putative E3 ubiquitin-protein ligase ZFP1 [Silene latifolia]|uniref:putative E3 ubiquitin-protein ligase ZFP1 n=1 Tax=Silene latifolia TaxID=37657 RepID=UPI003D77D119
MDERNMLCSSHQTHDLANGQQVQGHLRQEPCILMSNTSNFHPSHMNQGFPPSGNVNNFDLHHLSEHVGRPTFFGMAYNQSSHPATNLEIGLPTASNFFNLHLNPAPGARVFPVPLNHGFADHSASSSNYGSNGVSFGEYDRRSNFQTEDVRGLCKRKNAEGMPGNVHHFGASAGPSSSSAAPMTSCHFDSGPASMEAQLALPEYIGNGNHSMMEVGSGVNARHRSNAVGLHMDSGMLHSYNYLPQGNYGNQSFPPSGCTWLEQQAINNGGLPWNGLPMLPYFQGSSVHGGASDLRSGGLSGYPEASNNHGSANFLPSQPLIQQHHNLHPSQNMQGVRGYGVACYPPFPAGPSRVPTNESLQHDAMSLSPESPEAPNRPTGIRIYRSQGRGMLPDGVSRRRDLPRLRHLQADRVAILEFPNLYEVDFDEFNDNHRDMRLDIDDMSYEELLALSERIGTVSTGLSEDDITGHLKTKRYSSIGAINLEELPCMDQTNDSCIICQDEYEDRDEVGELECGHDYHADCLKKWLLVKNVCPICKSPALKVESKDQ